MLYVKKPVFILSILVLSLGARSQQYSFSLDSGEYVNINKHVIVKSDENDWQELMHVYNLSFNFSFFGRAFSQVTIHNGGFLLLGEISDPCGISFCGATRYAERYRGGLPPASVVGFDVKTLADNKKVFRLEFENVGVSGADSNTFANAQVWLYESGLIEMRYGSSAMRGVSWDNGYTGPFVGIDSSDNDVLFLVTGPPRAPVISSDPAKNLDAFPPSGTIYRFTPLRFTGSSNVPEEKKGWGVYPNPSSGRLYFSGKLPATGIIEITDFSGKMVLRASSGDLPAGIDLTGLEPGIYFLRMGAYTQKIHRR